MDDKILITTDSGARVEAHAPVIVSASRATDIPAFYARWFVNRLAKGYAVWYNPFNGRPMYVSFGNTRVVVFWSKNPKPLIPYLRELDDRGVHYYFQFTLNDYEREGFEPGAPPLNERIDTFRALSDRIGKEKVIWRFDPLLLAPTLTPGRLLEKIRGVGDRLKGYTDKLVFSFVDVKVYRKVRNNLVKETAFFTEDNVENAEPNGEQRREIAEGLAGMCERWKSEGWDVSPATCAEQMDLEQYGIGHNRCIDGELMRRIFSGDEDLMYYLSCGRLPDRNALFAGDVSLKRADRKDRGQRAACGCMASKDIGMYNTCPHHCVYCYANASRETVRNNASLFDVESESIITRRNDGNRRT
ncbi:MAG: DUF1848 domain-containing protein [Tannerella sp.]|jgi:DNA repair photolyase|nr:DUF1848 domain-containing protein [Tannerella sp.]